MRSTASSTYLRCSLLLLITLLLLLHTPTSKAPDPPTATNPPASPTATDPSQPLTLYVCYGEYNFTVTTPPSTPVSTFVLDSILSNEELRDEKVKERLQDGAEKPGWLMRLWEAIFGRRRVRIHVLSPSALTKKSVKNRKGVLRKKSFVLRPSSTQPIGERVRPGSLLVLGRKPTSCKFDQLGEGHPWVVEMRQGVGTMRKWGMTTEFFGQLAVTTLVWELLFGW